MTLSQFFRKNKEEIDQYIRAVVTNEDFVIDDAEREMWVYNDEYLYNLAKDQGVMV